MKGTFSGLVFVAIFSAAIGLRLPLLGNLPEVLQKVPTFASLPDFLQKAPGFGLKPASLRPILEWIPGTEIALIPFKPNRNATSRAIVPTYYLSSASAPQSDCALYCASTGRQLLSIKNDLEQKDIEMLLAEYLLPGNVWMSGFCYNGKWTWGDLKAVSPLFNKLPNGNVNCAPTSDNLMMFGPTWSLPNRFSWKNEYGTEYNYFICKS